jgi:hypothetical protein
VKNISLRLVALAGIAFASIMSTPGCGNIDDVDVDVDGVVTDEVATASNALRSHRYRHPPRGGGTPTGGATGGSPGNTASGGSSGSTGTGSPGTGGTSVAGCDVCAKANACCLAVNGGALCSYSATTCSTVAAASRSPYINACLTLITQTVAAHQAAKAAPPAACL